MTRIHKGWIFYYLALLVVLIMWSGTSIAPPAIVRVLFLIAVLIPSFIKDVPLLFPYVVFFTISSYGAAYSYMPSTLYIYALIALLLFIIRYKYNKPVLKNRFVMPNSVLLLLMTSFFVNLFSIDSHFEITWALLIIVLLSPMLKLEDNESHKIFSICFMVVSLVLSVMFIVLGQQYAETYSAKADLERMYWMDPNYFCCVVGMGAIIASCELFAKRGNILLSVFSVVVLLLATYTIIVQASRGALLALVSGFSILLMFSRTRWVYKIIFLGVIIYFVYRLYTSSAFELLLYRMEQDADGSGRLSIWRVKTREFLENGHILNYVFGMGWEKVMKLGSSSGLGVHNDYLAFLMEYGIVGFILFLISLLSPIAKLREKRSLPVVLSLTIYLAVCCFTLEPLTLGRLVYFIFYVYVYYTSQNVLISGNEKN